MAKENSSIELDMLTDAQRKKLRDGINTAVVQEKHIADLRDMLKEDIKDLADELGVEVSDIKSAVRSVVKQNFFDAVNKQERVESILTITGLLAKAEGEDAE